MDLRPGCRLAVATNFHLPVDWPDRVRLGVVEAHAGRFLPGPAWRAPTPAEQRLLFGEADPDDPGPVDAAPLWLFALPRHLHSAFWATLEQPPGAPVPHPEGYARFVAELAGFLDFKRLPAPPGAVFDLVVGRPGEGSIQWDMEARRAIGLTFNLAGWLAWPVEAEASAPRLWGGCNVGDEAVSLLFVNRTAPQLAADLARDRPADPPPATLDELARQALTRWGDYPLVRLRLEPGEGYRVPAGGLLIDVATLDMQGPAMLLMIRDPGARYGEPPA